jgi:cell division protein FtsL
VNERNRSALFAKAIDNSQVIRERDPHAHRRLGTVLLVVALLVGGLVLYAWPHFESLQTGMAAEQLQREKERLREENRKLQLERATLEDLARVETIAARRLGLEKPKPGQVVVVERLPAAAADERSARRSAREDKSRDRDDDQRERRQ